MYGDIKYGGGSGGQNGVLQPVQYIQGADRPVVCIRCVSGDAASYACSTFIIQRCDFLAIFSEDFQARFIFILFLRPSRFVFVQVVNITGMKGFN